MSGKRLKVGIVGAGRMAREHARAFRDIADIELAGITSRTAERAAGLAREFSIAKTYTRIGEMIDVARPDILVVAVPEPSTVAVMRECVGNAGVILVEKPVGVDLSDCRAVCNLARSAGTPVFVGLNRRSYGSIRAALASLPAEDGARFIEIHDQEDIAAARNARRPEEVIRNWMFANSIHMIDFFRIFGRGEVAAVNIVQPWRGDAPAHVVAHLTFSSGDTGLYHAVWNMPGPWACTVTTAARRVEMRPVETSRMQLAGSRDVSDFPADARDVAFKPGFRLQAEEVAGFGRNGTNPRHVPDIVEALATTELVARLYATGSVSA
jgi:predicted dehydrogenase